MRLALSSLLLCALAVFSMATNAQDTSKVAEIAAQLSQNQQQFERDQLQIKAHQDELTLLHTQLQRMQAQVKQAERQQQLAKQALDEGYQAFLKDPNTPLTSLQKDYQQATQTLHDKQAQIHAQQAAINGQRESISALNTAVAQNRKSKLALQQSLDQARVERLRTEFARKGTLEVVHTINCQRDETLGQCERRGQQQGLSKATSRFLDQVYNNLSEYRLVSAKRDLANARVKVVSSHVVDSAFSGQGNFNVNLSVAMAGEIDNSQLCSLLEVDPGYCQSRTITVNRLQNHNSNNKVSQGQLSEQSDNTGSAIEVGRIAALGDFQEHAKDAKPVTLTVRSNVVDDTVFINGEPYGQTKLDVTLPLGEYQVEVRKPGYKSYQVKVVLEKPQVVYAQLSKSAVKLASK